MSTPTRDTKTEELRALMVGITKHLGTTTMNFGGVEYTGATAVTRLQKSLDAATAVRMARATLEGALQAERALAESEAVFLRSVKTIVLSMFRNDPVALTDFALAPKKKRAPLTTEQKLVMAAKNRATRKERGTMSKKQKAAIHGNVTGVVITPIKSDG